MKRTIFALLAGSSLLWSAADLPSLLDAASGNELVDTYRMRLEASKRTYESARASYYPRLDAGATGSILDKTGTIDVKETYTAYAKASVVLFDGFRRERILDEKRALTRADDADLEGYQKELSLQVTRNYFELMNLNGDLDAQLQRRKQLSEQLERQRRFFEARIATEEDVERIRAAVANADYEIAGIRYRMEEYRAELFVLTGMTVTDLEASRFDVPAYGDVEEPDAIRSLRNQAEALDASAEQQTSSHYPSLSLEDTYTFYDYHGVPSAFAIERADAQNRFTIQLSMNLVDFAAASRAKEAVLAQKQAVESRIAHERKRADSNVALAIRSIERAETLIEAAEQSLAATGKTLNAVTQKYRARVVDYVKYLDALYEHTDAMAQYNRAKNTLQLAYAQYYYHAGFDLKEFVR